MVKRIEEYLEQAREKFHAGDFENARNSFSAAIQMDPENSQALNGYAACLCELNNGVWSEEAVEVLLKALRSDSKNAKAWNNVGDFHFRRGDFALAVEYFEKAIKSDPYYLTPYVNLALAHRNRDDFPKALKALAQALQLKPRSGWARFQLALTFLYRGFSTEDPLDFDKAHEVLLSIKEQNLEIGPEVKPGDIEQLIRLTSSIEKSKGDGNETFRTLLAVQLQYIGKESDHEIQGHLLN